MGITTPSSNNPLNLVPTGSFQTVQAQRDPSYTDNFYPINTEWKNTVTGVVWKFVGNTVYTDKSIRAVWGAFISSINSTVDPTSSDYLYPVGQIWVNTSSNTIWGLSSVSGQTATWKDLSAETTGAVGSLTGNDTNIVLPDTNGNINVLGDNSVTYTKRTTTNSLTVIVQGGTAGQLLRSNGLSSASFASSTDTNFTFGGQADAGTARFLTVSNTDNSNTSSSAGYIATVGGTGAGPAYNQWNVGAAKSYSVGVDTQSSGQPFKINYAATSGVTPASGTVLLSYSPTTNSWGMGASPASTAILTTAADAVGQTGIAINNTHAAGGVGDCVLGITTGNGGGIPYVFWGVNSAAGAVMGIDQADSNKLKIKMGGSSWSGGSELLNLSTSVHVGTLGFLGSLISQTCAVNGDRVSYSIQNTDGLSATSSVRVELISGTGGCTATGDAYIQFTDAKTPFSWQAGIEKSTDSFLINYGATTTLPNISGTNAFFINSNATGGFLLSNLTNIYSLSGNNVSFGLANTDFSSASSSARMNINVGMVSSGGTVGDCYIQFVNWATPVIWDIGQKATDNSFIINKASSSTSSNMDGTTAFSISTTGDITLGEANTNVLSLNNVSVSTIGANGAASALTLNPVGYISVNINGSAYQIPYYNHA